MNGRYSREGKQLLGDLFELSFSEGHFGYRNKHLLCGIPQKSLLGALLFIIFVNNVVSSEFDKICM